MTSILNYHCSHTKVVAEQTKNCISRLEFVKSVTLSGKLVPEAAPLSISEHIHHQIPLQH